MSRAEYVLNECISRAFRAAGIPVKKKTADLVQSDRKRPSSCYLIPWRRGRPLAWNVTVCTTVAAFYLTVASHTAGAVAEQAVDRKCSKYIELSSTREFQPVAVESHGPLSDTTASSLQELDRKITDHSDEPLEVQFLFQRVSVLAQRFNFILFRETFFDEDDTDT